MGQLTDTLKRNMVARRTEWQHKERNSTFQERNALPCDLMFGCASGKELVGEDSISKLLEEKNDIHEEARFHIQVVGDYMKECYTI